MLTYDGARMGAGLTTSVNCRTASAGPASVPGIGHSHDHGAGGRAADARALGIVLALTAGFAALEVVGGLIAGSVALLADAGHMLSDAASLALALVAVWLARRPATTRMSFGWRRAEILAALANGVALVAVGLWILIEALQRLPDPPHFDALPTLVIGLAGLVVNVVGAGILWRSGGESLNVRAALFHVLADLLGSAGVVVAALLAMAFGWWAADPIAALLIGILVLIGAWRVLRESLAVLLEATPEGIDADEVGRRMAAMPGVREVHDLHVWTITSGFPALSAHVLVGPGEDCHARRRELAAMLDHDFHIHHSTLQVEHESDRRLHTITDAPAGGV
jgi:cobalt-zinc-cadmium efflux system protein